MTPWRLLFLLSMVFGLLAGCNPTTTEPLPIGHLMPMSGPDEFAGDRSRQAILLTLEELNQEENRRGQRPIQVQHADSRHGPGTATRLLKVDRVLALLDTSEPDQLPAIAAAALAAETPVVSINPWGPLPPNEFVVSLTARPVYQGQVMAGFARDDLKLDSALVLARSRTPACAALADAFAQEFAKKGGQVGQGPLAVDSDVSLKDHVEALKKARAIFLAGTTTDLSQLRDVLREAASMVPVLYAGDEGALAILAEAPITGGPVYVLTAFSPSALTPAAQEFAKKYKEKFGRDLDPHVAVASDGVRLLTEAVRKAKAPGPEVRKELKAIEKFESITGPVTFTKEGCARRPMFVFAVESGQAREVKRADAEP